MPLFLASFFDDKVWNVFDFANNEVVGWDVFNNLATKAGLEGGYASVAMVWLVWWGNSPEIETLDTFEFEVFHGLPNEGVGAWKFAVEFG